MLVLIDTAAGYALYSVDKDVNIKEITPENAPQLFVYSVTRALLSVLLSLARK